VAKAKTTECVAMVRTGRTDRSLWWVTVRVPGSRPGAKAIEKAVRAKPAYKHGKVEMSRCIKRRK